MSRRDEYPAGVPCFVDTLTADLEAAKGFYGGIFGWDFAGPGPMPGDPPGRVLRRPAGRRRRGRHRHPAGVGRRADPAGLEHPRRGRQRR